MIKFEEISFTFSDSDESNQLLFDKLNLHIQYGEYLAIIGPNGSGKTTLAMIVKGLYRPVGGKIYYSGEDVTAKGINHKVGYIFSNPENQIVSSVVEEDIAFGPENQGRKSSDIREAVSRALELGKIKHLKSNLTHLLSGGEQQKVIIAGILAMNVECIIFDEAASMLDPVGKREVLALLHRLNKSEGITIIHITHNVEDILSADRVIVMDSGKIIFGGSPHLLLHKEDLMDSLKIKSQGKLGLIRKLLQNGIISRDDLGCIDSMVKSISRHKESLH
ncbi:MAG: ATP-binding cassette domain-containing protein [Proteobacteria bacterium]|nr:ATP-binding cassette domain-containing protein [Pseudomonadota bacterium]